MGRSGALLVWQAVTTSQRNGSCDGDDSQLLVGRWWDAGGREDMMGVVGGWCWVSVPKGGLLQVSFHSRSIKKNRLYIMSAAGSARRGCGG